MSGASGNRMKTVRSNTCKKSTATHNQPINPSINGPINQNTDAQSTTVQLNTTKAKLSRNTELLQLVKCKMYVTCRSRAIRPAEQH